MKKLLSLFALSILTIVLAPSVAFAAKPVSGGGVPKPAPTVEFVGYDISYPQCGKRLPTDHYFGIVGVNNGLANGANPCLGDQLVWASKAKVGSNQSKRQVYVNTANPGQVIAEVTTWPTTNYDLNGNLPANPYTDGCDGSNSTACSWLYGWNRSIYTEGVFRAAANSKGLNSNTADYIWWLDVETMNTWQTGDTQALIHNTAAIEGFGAYYKSKGATIGLYSTAVQWTAITGNNIGPNSNLNGLPNWRPSGASLANAKDNCTKPALTPGGFVSLTQYVVKNLDYNHSCM